MYLMLGFRMIAFNISLVVLVLLFLALVLFLYIVMRH
jgi:hypothetical protein